jgi:hypothetical protein
MRKTARILCLGVYLLDREHTAHHIGDILSRSQTVCVETRWTALAPNGGKCDVPDTVAVVDQRTPKCVLINRMLDDFDLYDWIILCDDDVEVAEGFADSLIAVANHADLSLVQPARTLDSYIDHPFVGQFPGLLARRTRFVEIGPVVCMRADAAKLLLPFAPDCEMGWGLDYVWPARMEAAGLRMGIIDAVPVAHRLRAPVSGYNYETARAEMERTLAREPSLATAEAFHILEVFS